MSQKLLVALFEDPEDVQTALNEITQAGFDTQDISIITKDKLEDDEPEENDFDYESELDDDSEAPHGLIDPITTSDSTSTTMYVPSIGGVVLGGPIANVLSDLELEDNLDDTESEIEFTKILSYMGISFEDSTSYESCLGSDYTLIAVPVEEDVKDEIETILSNCGAESVEETTANW